MWHLAAPDECDGTSAVGESRPFQAHPLVNRLNLLSSMHLAKPCCEPVMDTGSPDRMPADTAGRTAAWLSGFLRVHPTHRLGVPGGSHAGMAETVSAFVSEGEGRQSDGGDEQIYGAE